MSRLGPCALLGNDAIAAVEPSGHGTDEDAPDNLQR
jgi:hypothetical protein